MNKFAKVLSKVNKPPKKTNTKTKTKTNTKTNTKYNNAATKTHKYFIPHARLNRGQRRYCHCIMKARVSKPKGNHYGFCQGIARADWAKAKTMKNKISARQYYFDISRTNCVMNYDYNDYSLIEVRQFATEKGLPIYELDNSGNKKYYPKDRLVQLLTTNYIKKHTTSSTLSKKSNRQHLSPKAKKTKKAKLKQ